MTPKTIAISDKLEKRFLCDLEKNGVESVELIGNHCFPHIPRTYYSALLSGRRIFIKLDRMSLFWRGRDFNFETEFTLCDRLHKINHENFPEVFFFLRNKGYSCIAYEFVEGKNLREMNCGDLPLDLKENFIIQLKKIAENLWETGIVHQDIHWCNFIALEDGTLKLIDFGFSYDVEDPPWMKRYSLLRKFPPLFHLLVKQKTVRGKGRDDSLAMLRVLEQIGFHESYQKHYRDLESYLKQRIGKRLFVHTRSRTTFLVYTIRKWLKRKGWWFK